MFLNNVDFILLCASYSTLYVKSAGRTFQKLKKKIISDKNVWMKSVWIRNVNKYKRHKSEEISIWRDCMLPYIFHKFSKEHLIILIIIWKLSMDWHVRNFFIRGLLVFSTIHLHRKYGKMSCFIVIIRFIYSLFQLLSCWFFKPYWEICQKKWYYHSEILFLRNHFIAISQILYVHESVNYYFSSSYIFIFIINYV